MEEPQVSIHDRVFKRHSHLTKDGVLQAWRNRVTCQVRLGPWPPQYVAVGFDDSGHSIEMVAVYDPVKDEVLIFHVNSPVTDAVRRELGIGRR